MMEVGDNVEPMALTEHDLAAMRGTYAMTIAGSTRVTDRGHYMGLMRQQPDLSWLWTTDMAVSELAAPMA